MPSYARRSTPKPPNSVTDPEPVEHARRGPIKARITELNSLIRISRKHLHSQCARIGSPLIKPTDIERLSLGATSQELLALESEWRMLRRELNKLPSRARHYAQA